MSDVYPFLLIEGDPTTWVLSTPIDPAALTVAGAPFRATITAPRAGTLLLSSRAAASVVLTDIRGSIPNGGGIVSQPVVYLPSAAGLTPKSPALYLLPIGTNLAAVEGDITAAMSESTFCTVAYRDGTLVLNGATLPFVALFPAS